MTKNPVRFPRAYDAVILILLFVVGAFVVSVLTMGGISQNDSVLAPRLLAAAAALHAYSLVTRAGTGVRIRWVGLLFLPFALWLFADSRFHSPAAWRGREQAVIALTGVLAFWVTLHHLRHVAHKWFVFGI